MKFLFLAIGKTHEPYVKNGVEEFTGRLDKYFKTGWQLIAAPKNAASLPEPEQVRREGELILAQLSKDDYLVALEETGTMMSSEGLAKFIQARANDNTRQIVFLIGGAFGLDDAVLKRANLKWSLSDLVFPHQLVRLILAEQVYRACTILKNEKYHHK